MGLVSFVLAMHDLHKCSKYLKFFCLSTIRVYPWFTTAVLFTTSPCLLFVSANTFCKLNFFYLDKQHPFGLEKLPVSTEFRISSIPPFFKCLRVRPCECGCIHEDSLLPIPPGGFNFPQLSCGWSTCGWMPGCISQAQR
jgi:hypothetical protein